MSETQRLAIRVPEDVPRRYILDGRPTAVPRLTPGLHIVATPSGNLGDITPRALSKEADHGASR